MQHLVERAIVVNGEFPNAKQMIRSPANHKGHDHGEDCPEMPAGDQHAALLHLEDEAQIANAHRQQREQVPSSKFHPGQNMVPHHNYVRIMLMEIVVADGVVIELDGVPEVQGRAANQRS